MMMVDVMRYRDKDDDEGNDEDNGEDDGETNAEPILARYARSILPLTYLLQPILTVIQFYIIFIIILI